MEDESKALSTSRPAPRTSRPFLDTHQHLWDLDRFRLPWLDGGGPLARSHRMADYQMAAAGLNLAASVYMEVDVTPDQQALEAEYVLELCRRDDNPMVAAVIGGRPASDDFGAYLDRLRDCAEVKGVRQVLHVAETPPGYCLSPTFIRGVRHLGERGLSFDLCLRSNELLDGARLAEACPETRFILDHCGNANVQSKDRSQWQRDIEQIARQSNVVCKISGIVASAKPDAWSTDDLAPIINHVASEFGPNRIFFGSDWPVCTLAATYRQWVEALQTIVAGWPAENQRKLFHKNAVEFYRLAGALPELS